MQDDGIPGCSPSAILPREYEHARRRTDNAPDPGQTALETRND